VGAGVGVSLPLKTIDKANSAYEVGEMGVVQQLRKLEKEVVDEKTRRDKAP
jgi:hypothetical protein